MAAVVINGDTSGSVTLQAPAVAGSTVVTLPTTSMNMGTGGGSVATNTAFGTSALNSNTTGSNNVALGEYALRSNNANNNVAVGLNSGYSVSSGTQNTLIGTSSGYSGTNNLTTGSNNTIIGYNAAASSASVSNEITLGNSSISTLRCQVTSITSLSDARDKTNIVDINAGLNLINAVRPVSFDWNMRDGGKVGEHDTGFIAQELKAAQESIGVIIPGLVDRKSTRLNSSHT